MVTVILVIASTVAMSMTLCDRITAAACMRLNAEAHTPYGELAERSAREIKLLYGRGTLSEYFGTDDITEEMYAEVAGIWPLNALTFSEVVVRNYYDPPTFLRMMRMLDELMR